jgi:hypothetical protein
MYDEYKEKWDEEEEFPEELQKNTNKSSKNKMP